MEKMASNTSVSNHPINNSLAMNWCYTDVNVTNFDFLWIIKDFSLRIKDCYQFLKSSIFNGGGDGKNTWRLIMHPKGSMSRRVDSVSIELELISHSQDSLKAMISFSVLNAKGDVVKYFKNGVPHDFETDRIFACKEFLTRSEIFNSEGGLLHGDTLSILCKIDLLCSDVNVCGKSIISSLAATESLLSDDFNRLFENGKFSDVTLVVGKHEFRVHKAVLAARSQVFAAMFEHDMAETNSNRVIITDMDPDVLREMLHYIYTNNAPRTESLAKQLLVAADKYGLVQLMRICEFVVGRGIYVDIAADMLLLADNHNAQHLKAHAIEYINLNATAVMATEGWRNLEKSHCHLIADTYQALITQMKNAKIQD